MSPRRALFWIYLAGMLAIFLLPVPGSPFPATGRLDKLVHFALFLGFAVLYRVNRRSTPVRILLISTGLAGAVELVQGILPYRAAEWGDFFLGSAGALAGILLTLRAPRPRPSTRPTDR